MLDPWVLDSLPDTVVQLYEQTAQDIIADMARRISQYDYYIPAAEHQRQKLREMGAMQQEIVKQLSTVTGRSQEELKKLMQQTCDDALENDRAYYKQYGAEAPTVLSDAMKSILAVGYQSTGKLFKNLTKTTASAGQTQFVNALDRAWLQVSSGAFDYNTAIRSAVKDLSRQGLHAVHYPTGHSDTLEVAVRRAVVTGVNQTAAQLQLQLAAEVGSDLVETTAHAGARPDHAEWQGQVFSLSGKHPKYPDFRQGTGYGTGAGLCGWNCRHSFFPYFEGQAQAYSREELQEYDAKNIEYNGRKYTEYEASQIQRCSERQIRRWKREYAAMEAAGLNTTEAEAKLQGWQKRLSDFLNQKQKAFAVHRSASFKNTSGISSDFAKGMYTSLKKSPHLEIRAIYAKYQSEIKCIDNQYKKGAYFMSTDGGIYFDERSGMLGSSYQAPYEVAFHEFGHNIDWLIGGKNHFAYSSNLVYNERRLQDVIKSDYLTFRKSVNAESNVELLKILKAEQMPLTECGNVSDILEYCTNKSYPLGIGHGKAYHNRQGATEREFFAEVLASAAVNQASFRQLQRIFPNAVDFVFDIIKGVI